MLSNANVKDTIDRLLGKDKVSASFRKASESRRPATTVVDNWLEARRGDSAEETSKDQQIRIYGG